MNIIFGKHDKDHKDGQGYMWYDTNTYYSSGEYFATKWSRTLDLIPEPKIYSPEFLKKYGDENKLMKNNKLYAKKKVTLIDKIIKFFKR